jgi:hypothetical protein
MEMRNKMFETGNAEYNAMEYLPGLNRNDRGVAATIGDAESKKVSGEEGLLQRKQQKIYAAMRFEFPLLQRRRNLSV